MRILTASDRALLVEADDLDEAMRLHLAWQHIPGVIERVPGARTVLVRFDPARVSAHVLAEVLTTTHGGAANLPPTSEVTIPVRYDGEDLDEVARELGVPAEEVIRRHQAAQWRVAFSGFAPGFGYIVGDDPLFDVPRRSSPRTRVLAGAVALAGHFTGVYPRSSPGGWQLIGRTDAVLWDVDRDPPALLTLGARVRFEQTERELTELATTQRPGAASLRIGVDRGIEVVSAPLQLLVQDRGRPGHAALGVSVSGAADRVALHDANRAVGNDAGAAVLEVLGGAVLRFRGDAVAAVTGAVGALMLTRGTGETEHVAHGTPFAAADGDEVTLDHPSHGLRYVVAVRGGVLAPETLGSRSTDTLADLGPAPLRAGDVVTIGTDAPHSVEPMPVPRRLPAATDLVTLDITLGPRDDWFTSEAHFALTDQEWTVTAQSDRIGIRLSGDQPLTRLVEGELPSEGAETGAIQVPPDGQPVLFLPDHPVTGGYPIIGTLTARSLDLVGQLPPGVRIRFRVASPPASPLRSPNPHG